MLLYEFIIFMVIGPGSPLPIFSRSIFVTGVTSAPVPDKKISSAFNNSAFEIFLIFAFNLISLEKEIIEFLVIPSNADELSGGVIRLLFFTTKMFSPGASLTSPNLSRRIASSKPLLFAS